MTHKSTQTPLKSQSKGSKKAYISSGVVVFLIAISPYLFYIYESFPADSKIWETFLFDIETHYLSIQHYAWFVTGKAIPLYLLLIWFFTCKHWWHWIILIPIAMYIFQLWNIINQSKSIDVVELIYMIPVMLIVVPMVYLIRAKLFSRIRNMDSEEFEEDLYKERTMWDELKDLFR